MMSKSKINLPMSCQTRKGGKFNYKVIRTLVEQTLNGAKVTHMLYHFSKVSTFNLTIQTQTILYR